MGQYYKTVILSKEGKIQHSFHPHAYENGLKLMEHSYMGNNMMNAVERFLIDNPSRLVWAGDYDSEKDANGRNLYFQESEADDGDMTIRVAPTEENQKDLPKGMYVLNNTKKEYYERDYIEKLNSRRIPEWSWAINPLSLLTIKTDGGGGGDYYGKCHRNMLGRWAGDEIEITAVKPQEGYPDYKRIVPTFREK